MTALDIILEGCETEEEYNNAIYMEAVDIQLEKDMLARDTYLALEKLNQRASACKAATIADDFDKMVAFYEDENESKENNNQNKEGLLHKVWQGIKNLFNKIKETVFGSKVKEVPEEKKGKCPKAIKGLKEALEKAVAAINKALSGKAGDVLNAIGAIAGVYNIKEAIESFANKHKDGNNNDNGGNNDGAEEVEITGKEGNIITRAAEKACTAVNGVLEKFEALKPGSDEVDEKNPGDKTADVNILTKIQNKLRDLGKFLGSIPGRVAGFFKKDDENSEDKGDENKEDKNDNPDGKNKDGKSGDEKPDEDKKKSKAEVSTDGSNGYESDESWNESANDFDESWSDYIDAILGE
jgi:hypothetical protein